MIFLIFNFILSSFLFAQVNLDQPIPVGAHDIVFRSMNDGNSAYLLPTRLIALTTPRVEEINGEYRAHFDVGMDSTQYVDVQNKVQAIMGANNAPLSLRMMHGWNSSLSPAGSMDIPLEYKPRLEALGDAGHLGAPLPYMLAIKKRGPKLGKESQALLKKLFSSDSVYHLGTVDYEFNAMMGGKPYLAQTSVGIFATNTGALDFKKAATRQVVASSRHQALAPIVHMDAENACWNQAQPGTICLRAQ